MKLKTVLTSHYCMHPIFCSNAPIEEIRNRSVFELYQLLQSDEHKLLLEYLIRNWYSEENFIMWGYRSTRYGTPMARTKMLVEAHWRVLKHRYLSMHKRPRMVFLAHVISAQMIPKYTREYKLFLNGTKKGSWWKEFVKSWKFLAAESVNNTYKTSLEMWWCSCPGFRCDRFFLCKHLCKLRPMPSYREIIRSRTPPFYVFQHQEGRHIPLLDGGVSPNFDFITKFPTQSSSISLHNNQQKPSNAGKNDSHISSTIAWLLQHITDLENAPTGNRQLMYFARTILPRIENYKRNIENELCSQQIPKTWNSIPDTMYLP